MIQHAMFISQSDANQIQHRSVRYVSSGDQNRTFILYMLALLGLPLLPSVSVIVKKAMLAFAHFRPRLNIPVYLSFKSYNVLWF